MKGNTTREKILIAAKEVFSKRGYMRATTKEISKLAKVAEVTLFRHFDTKDNLFYETITKYLVEPMLALETLNNNEDIKQSILTLTQERIDTLQNNRELFLCIIYEAQFNVEIKKMLENIHLKVFEVLKLHLELNENKINRVDIDSSIQMFLSTIIGVIIFETISDGEKNIASKELVHMIGQSIFGI